MVSRMEKFLGKSDINQSLSKIERIWYRKYDHNFEIYQNDDLYVIQKCGLLKLIKTNYEFDPLSPLVDQMNDTSN